MTTRDNYAIVSAMVKDCENYRNSLSADRRRAEEYYDGTMTDLLADANRSSVVSRDIRETVQKVLPAMTRVFLATDEIVEFQPGAAGDDDKAQQASDYINYVVFQEANGPRAIASSIHDALKLRNSVLMWFFEEKTDVRVSRHTGLSDEALAELVSDESVMVLEHTSRIEQIDTPEGKVPSTAHDAKLRRTITQRSAKVECIPMEEFLIHPEALDEDTAPIIGRVTTLRRTDLVAMGYKKDVVWNLSAKTAKSQEGDAERNTRRDFPDNGRGEVAFELQEIEHYELYVRLDLDGDGIAELRRMCFGGNISEASLLDDEEADEIPFAIVSAKQAPHQWEGISIADDLTEIQRIKTVLLRNTLDNLYWQNNMQMAVRADDVENIDAVTNPQFGQIIHLKNGVNVNEAIQPIVVPFVARESFSMLEYLDAEKQKRTGVSDASSGLAPDALQNMTAKASAMIEQQGIGQTELMARNFAVGFRRMFRGLLRLIVKHQDKPRTVRLRDKWVEFDPRHWNAEMDCVVNTGLGAGTRERDLAVLQQVLAAQKEIMANFGPNNPLVTMKHLSNALSKFAEAAGLKTSRLYFNQPDDDQLAKAAEEMASKPDPELIKLDKQLQANMQMKQMDMEASKFKEQVQSQAAIEEAAARAQIEAQGQQEDRALKKYEIDRKNEIEWAKINQSATLENTRMSREDQRHFGSLGLEVGEDGKPHDKASERMEQLVQSFVEHLNKPKRNRLVTPDGEEFYMETVN